MEIISFYSYKGGVGRSQLCANIAAYLSRHKGKKILLWDWDFEAPGLHYFFGKSSEEIHSGGTIAMLENYSRMMRTQTGISQSNYVFFNDQDIVPLSQGKNGSRIDLMPAGNYSDNNEFIYRMGIFDWYEFYELLDGKVYIEKLKEWIKTLDYDYVLIDSRTGIHDYLGICNLHLPDTNVVVMAANDQNMEGSRRIIDKILNADYTKKGYRKTHIFPVLSRINANHPKFMDWANKFTDKFHDLILSLDFNIHEGFSKQIFCDFYLDKTLLVDEPQFSAGENIFFSAEAQLIPRNSFMSKFANLGEYLVKIADEDNIGIYAQIDRETWAQYAEVASLKGENIKAAVAYEKSGNNEKSIEYGGTAEAYLSMAYEFNLKKDFEKSLEYNLKSLELKETSDAYYNIAYYNFNKKNYSAAAEYYEKAIELNKSDTDAYNNLGLCYQNMNDYEKAIAAFNTSLEINPSHSLALNNLGVCYGKLIDDHKALDFFLKSFDIDSKSAETCCNIGVTYYNLGNDEKTEEYLRQAIVLNPYFYEAYNALGHLYVKLNQTDKALDSTVQALKIRETNDAFSLLATIYSRLNEFDKAIENFEKAIAIGQECSTLNNYGFLYIKTGNLDKASNLLKDAISLGASEFGNMNLGHVFLAQKNQAEALKYYQISLENFADKSLFWKSMEEDIQYLEQYDITQEYFEATLQKLKENLTPEKQS
jgi:tetratricopeptide (TPR) repeat protein/MinD-like ATPase involved in chromosome partitioning or flagellar assembly